MDDKNLTLYNKNKIIELVSNMLKYYDNSENKKEVIKASHLLMDKVRYCDEENITLESDFIEEILFVLNEDGTKSIVRDIFGYLRSIGADLINVSFDNVHISGYYFNGLKNVEINIQKIPNYDISKTNLDGVTVKGTLNGANIKGTKFTGYIGNLVLNPQLIQNKDLYFTDINGLTVNGSFDGVNISCMRTKGFKGEIIINPQKVQNKNLSNINFDGIKFVGEYDKKTETYDDPCFDDCELHQNNFKGCIGNIVIHLDKLHWGASICNFTGVELVGNIKGDKSINLMYSYYEDENGKKIYLVHNKDNSEEPDTEEIINEENITTHKIRTRRPTFIKKIFGTSKK